jgi:hypothetical protein
MTGSGFMRGLWPLSDKGAAEFAEELVAGSRKVNPRIASR